MAVRVVLVLAVVLAFYGCGQFSPAPQEAEKELRNPPNMCEQVRKYEPNQPLREHICRPPKVREKLEEQHGVREPEGIEEQQRVGEPKVTIEL